MKKTLTIVIAVIVVALVVWFAFFRSSQPAEESADVLQGDTTSAIQEDLNSLDLGDIDAEFEAIDAELNQL